MGWLKKHKKELLTAAGLLGLGATGFGLAGAGPMAGLLGGGVAGGAGAAASLPGGLSAGAALGEGLGATAGGTGVLNGSGLLGLEKGLKGLQMANSLMPKDEPQQQAVPRPMAPTQVASNKELEELLKRLYGSNITGGGYV